MLNQNSIFQTCNLKVVVPNLGPRSPRPGSHFDKIDNFEDSKCHEQEKGKWVPTFVITNVY